MKIDLRFLQAGGRIETVICGEATVFGYCPPGTFAMGNSLSSDEIVRRWGGDKEWYDRANARQVTLTRGFFLCVHPVTRGAFGRFIQATGYRTKAERDGSVWGRNHDGEWGWIEGLFWLNPGFPQGDDHPVVLVGNEDARAYINWLNENCRDAVPEGFQFSLPTEAEWEYACRAGTTTEFFWGTNEAADGGGYLNAAYAPNDPQGVPFDGGYCATSPVCSFKPNPWGFYDMLGNVWERCSDWYGAYSSEPATDPVGSPTGDYYAIRGGCWFNSPRSCCSSCRDYCSCDIAYYLGLRLALKMID